MNACVGMPGALHGPMAQSATQLSQVSPDSRTWLPQTALLPPVGVAVGVKVALGRAVAVKVAVGGAVNVLVTVAVAVAVAAAVCLITACCLLALPSLLAAAEAPTTTPSTVPVPTVWSGDKPPFGLTAARIRLMR